MPNPTRRLIRIITELTILLIISQLIFFIIHYKLEELFDSLVNSSLSRTLFSLSISLPILSFILLQIFSYVLLIAWLIFITVSIGELFKLSETKTFLF